MSFATLDEAAAFGMSLAWQARQHVSQVALQDAPRFAQRFI